jgi:hypothetical protein
MAAPLVRQWICHSPNVMKTDIFAADNCGESGKSTRGSIRFDSPPLGQAGRIGWGPFRVNKRLHVDYPLLRDQQPIGGRF